MSEAKKVLVVFYSHSGNTRTIGQAIAEKLGADVEEIVEAKPKTGLIHFVASGFQAKSGGQAKIQPPHRDPALYDLVIVGSPVYAGTIASPVRTYLTEQKLRIKKVACFVTSGAPKNEPALTAMSQTLGKTPLAMLGTAAADVKTGAYKDKVTVFCAQLAR